MSEITEIRFGFENCKDVASEDCENKIQINQKNLAVELVDQLLFDIYHRQSKRSDSICTSASSCNNFNLLEYSQQDLEGKDKEELILLLDNLHKHLEKVGNLLVKRLKRRDSLYRQRHHHFSHVTNVLQNKCLEKSNLQFSIDPSRGESGFIQWKTAMKMVVQLPEGIPAEFRRKLWINLSENYLNSRKINWDKVERDCFSEWACSTDEELDVQIVKDLHRTGCSLFCGETGQERQAVLKRVLLAYARWNKHVGYCQGFNMLAALILQVTEGCESDALKIMIYLIEGVLPESYFADSLRGLSADMVVFRELLKARLPLLSNHLDKLQHSTKDGSISYEPPLTNVFTMQWFLTLFCNCLPHTTVLRVWDLIFLEGNDVLLRAALAIWQLLEERIMTVRNADEFYCIMGVLTREMVELDLVDANVLVELIMKMGPLTELKHLREKFLYNITPWATPAPSIDNDNGRQLKLYQKESLKLDISALKKQYMKLKHRQRQAHIIFTAAINKQPPPTTPPIAINHLLLGKSALMTSKRIGPLKGAIPPPRQFSNKEEEKEVQTPETLLWKDAEHRRLSTSSSSSSDTELCDDPIDNDESNKRYFCLEVDDKEPVDLSKTSDLTSFDNGSVILTVPDKGFSEEDNKEIKNHLIESDKEIIPEFLDPEMDEQYFEEFLKTRVETLNASPEILEEQEDQSVGDKKESRLRAFEIMQENSLILHRILQCQSVELPNQNVLEDKEYNEEKRIDEENETNVLKDVCCMDDNFSKEIKLNEENDLDEIENNKNIYLLPEEFESEKSEKFNDDVNFYSPDKEYKNDEAIVEDTGEIPNTHFEIHNNDLQNNVESDELNLSEKFALDLNSFKENEYSINNLYSISHDICEDKTPNILKEEYFDDNRSEIIISKDILDDDTNTSNEQLIISSSEDKSNLNYNNEESTQVLDIFDEEDKNEITSNIPHLKRYSTKLVGENYLLLSSIDQSRNKYDPEKSLELSSFDKPAEPNEDISFQKETFDNFPFEINDEDRLLPLRNSFTDISKCSETKSKSTEAESPPCIDNLNRDSTTENLRINSSLIQFETTSVSNFSQNNDLDKNGVSSNSNILDDEFSSLSKLTHTESTKIDDHEDNSYLKFPNYLHGSTFDKLCPHLSPPEENSSSLNSLRELNNGNKEKINFYDFLDSESDSLDTDGKLKYPLTDFANFFESSATKQEDDSYGTDSNLKSHLTDSTKYFEISVENQEYVKENNIEKVIVDVDEYSKALEKKYEELVLKPKRPMLLEIDSFQNMKTAEDKKKSIFYKINDEKTEDKANGGTEIIENDRLNKSPSNDPFPVHIRSRQNRDVGIRLGLYKK